MNMQRNRFLYFVGFVAVLLVVWFAFNLFYAAKTR